MLTMPDLGIPDILLGSYPIFFLKRGRKNFARSFLAVATAAHELSRSGLLRRCQSPNRQTAPSGEKTNQKPTSIHQSFPDISDETSVGTLGLTSPVPTSAVS